MATRKEIQSALQHLYDRMLFSKQVLHPVFGSSFKLLESVQKPFVEPTKSESSVISEVLIYGTITLEDGTDIICYEVTLQPSVRIEQSKIAIQQYVRKLLISGQAALINFIAPIDKDIWRFTLVAKDSKITDEGIAETQTHPQRYTYLVEKDRPNRTMAERLETLSLESEIDLEKLIKAFSVEAMSKAFFDEYKEHYQNFVEYLTGKRMVKKGGKWVEKQTGKASPFLASLFNGNEKDARDFIKKLMGRIVFLYFVQKKRWLGASTTDYNDGPYDFIFKLFDQTGGDEPFFPVGLSELFFNALNKERKDDDWKMPSGKVVKIPYLNGGLFVRDEIDEKIHKKGDLLTFPPGLFSHVDKMDTPNDRGFLDFLNAYNFTVYEDSQDDHTVAVDPEMLGHIFENLLEDNKDKGAFYTPKEIVHYMCQESLIEYLATNLAKEYKVYRQLDNDQVELFGNESNVGQLKMMEELGDKALNRKEVEHIVKDKDIKNLSERQLQRIDELLDSVKICDPAIGSGAFPMGLLQEIFSIKEASAYLLDKPFNAARTKENIISNSIYGVDIERGAVDIARLRFWLSLVVDEEKPKALPNLDYKIVLGNSLLSKFEGEIIEVDWDIEEGKQFDMFGNEHEQKRQFLLNEITKKQRLFFDPEHSGDKQKLKLDIRNQKIDILINQLELMINTKGVKDAPSKGVNEKNSAFTKRTNSHLRTIGWAETIQKLKTIQLNEANSFDHFDWKLDFPEVLNPIVAGDNLGFDILISNPPYIGQKGNKELFEPMKNSPNYEKQMDYWYFFLHKAYDLTKKSGINTFITSNYWVTANGSKKLRERVVNDYQVLRYINFNEISVFVAGVHTNIFILKRESLKNKYIPVTIYQDKLTERIIENLGSQQNYFSNQNYVFSDWTGYLHFLPESTLSIVNRLSKNSSKLSDNESIGVAKKGVIAGKKITNGLCNISPGVESGKDKGVFVLTNDEIEALCLTQKESDYVKRFYKNSDIGQYKILAKSDSYFLYVNNIESEAELKKFASLYKHFSSKKSLLEKRARNGVLQSAYKKGKWWALKTDRPNIDWSAEKIVCPQRSQQNKFALADSNFLSSVDVYYIVANKENVNLKYLLAILNSRVIYYWLYNMGKRKGKMLELYFEPLQYIPIKMATSEIQLSLNRIVDFILSEKYDSDAQKYFIKLSNAAVYELYFRSEFVEHGKSILQHLKDLPSITKEMTEEEKLRVCETVFNQLNDPSNPLRKNLDTLNEIPEVAIIEGINQTEGLDEELVEEDED